MVNIVHMSFYHGLESAMNAGRDLAIGDFVYEFDNMILENEKQIILDIYDKCINGFDIVSASCKENKNKWRLRK